MRMKSKLWQSSDAGALHPSIEKYTVGDDRLLDQRLLGYDITATKAHAHMLASIGILSDDEYKKLGTALDNLLHAWQTGDFDIGAVYEDGHTAIEMYLTDKLGNIGKKVHTGRSRNDQALVMMRLFMKDQLGIVYDMLDTAVDKYDAMAKRYISQPMPGYTHTQKAMPTTVGTWLGSYGDALRDMKGYVQASVNVVDQNPLGSAAGFGVSLDLDCAMTTRELGFAKIQANPMYCGLSRGVFELVAIQALAPIMVFAGKFATDMLLFTSQEFDFFRLPTDMTTGSSIMPHKRNYDVFEIMRATSHGFSAHTLKLQSITASVGSGYHRDLQLTKATTLQAFDECISTLKILSLVVGQLESNPDKLDAAMTDELYTVEAVNKLVAQGVPFRDAYKQVKDNLKN